MSGALLTLAQWLSPAYPVGAFAYSHGLETAIARGQVSDAPALQSWLEVVLAEGSGRTDAILLHAAHGAESDARLEEIDATARAFAASAERLREAERQGAAFAATTRSVWALDLPDMLYPVAVGRAAGLLSIGAADAAAMYLQSFAGNLVSAAVRLVPLGQTEGQAVLAALAPLCRTLAEESAAGELEDLWSNAWASDIAAMAHETLDVRLFQS